MLEETFVSTETGFFKCFFTIGEDKYAVKIILQHISAEKEENSWISAGGIIGPMGQTSNLFRMLEYLNENMIPSYALSMERSKMTLILTRSFRLRNLDLHSMYDLTDRLAKMVLNLRKLMIPLSVV